MLLRIDRQQKLQPLHRVKRQNSKQIEGEKGKGVVEPTLLFGWIDACNPVQRLFDRSQDWAKHCPFAGKDPGHIIAKRLGQRRDKSRKSSNLRYANISHFCPSPSRLRIKERQARA